MIHAVETITGVMVGIFLAPIIAGIVGGYSSGLFTQLGMFLDELQDTVAEKVYRR